MKRIWKDYFSFSKKERTAIIILLLLMGVFGALPYFFPVKGEMPVVSAELKQFLAENDKRNTDSNANKPAGDHYADDVAGENTRLHLFRFDPNTIGEPGWIALGLSPKLAATIIRYRNKGGSFRSAEDLRKIWGLRKDVADQLIPYAQIAGSTVGQKKSFPSAIIARKNAGPIDINTAGLDDWKQLPGIGDVFAARILAYRQRMEGFTKISQLKKVYGISDSLLMSLTDFLRIDTNTMKKLDINTVSQYTLGEQTGISREVARAIIVSRQQYGPYTTVADLRRIVFINDSLFALIRPYIMVSKK